MLESVIQKKCIIELEKFGFYVVKLEKTNKNGIPDLMALKNGEAIFIEVKTEKTDINELQRYRINEITEKTGCKCYVVHSVDYLFSLGIIDKP